MAGNIRKRAAGVFIILVCLTVLYGGAAEWTDVAFAEAGEMDAGIFRREAGSGDSSAKAGNWRRKALAPDEMRYSIRLAEGGKEYTVTLEQDEETEGLFIVCVWDGGEFVDGFLCTLEDSQINQWWCEDLNFDGFPDLVLGCSRHDKNADYCKAYLWDKENTGFGWHYVEIPSEYVLHGDKGVFTAAVRSGRGVKNVMYRIGESGSLSKLCEWTVDYWYREQEITVPGEENSTVLYKGSMETVSEEEGEEIFWSSLLGPGQEGKVYWSLAVEDYEVSLRDLIPGQSLQLTLEREGEEKILRVYQKDWDYSSPSEYRAEAFEQLLGHNGFCMHVEHGVFYQSYYYALEGEELVCLADSFRPHVFADERLDYMVDLDGDGERELVCEVMFGGDGAARTYIYDFDGQQVWIGRGDALLDVKDWYDWGVNSTASEYLPEKKAVGIVYSREGEEYGYREYAVDLEKLDMVPYDEKY